MARPDLTRAAIAAGYRIARAEGTTARELFDLSLEGDLARFTVARTLRREFPRSTAAEREAAIEEALTP